MRPHNALPSARREGPVVAWGLRYQPEAVIVGGDKAAYAARGDLFHAMGANVFHAGAQAMVLQ